jgi:hypothetical protein
MAERSQNTEKNARRGRLNALVNLTPESRASLTWFFGDEGPGRNQKQGVTLGAWVEERLLAEATRAGCSDALTAAARAARRDPDDED